MLTMHQTEYSALGPFVPPGPHACCSYSSWRTRKICGYPESLTDLVVDIGDPRKLLAGEGRALINCIRRANVAIYRCADPGGVSTESIAMLGRQLGLTTPDRTLSAVVDGIAAIEVRATGRMGEYIPYTDRPINWHTDGYYDAAPARIQAFIMHCARPAVSGGANRLLDADMVYIALRDANPAYVEALMRPDVMTIPANIDGGQVLRPEVTGPVFARAGGRPGAAYAIYQADQVNPLACRPADPRSAGRFCMRCSTTAPPMCSGCA